jgi:hypothetical protein
VSRSTALVAGRHLAEEGMIDTCRVYGLGAPVLNTTTGEATPPEIVRFTSPCKVSVGSLGSLIPTSKELQAGGREVTQLRLILYLPMDAPEFLPNDVVEITAIGEGSDPSLLGRKMRVVAPVGQTFATQRRFSVEEILA